MWIHTGFARERRKLAELSACDVTTSVEHRQLLPRRIKSFYYLRPSISLLYKASIAGTNRRARICAFMAPLVSTT